MLQDSTFLGFELKVIPKPAPTKEKIEGKNMRNNLYLSLVACGLLLLPLGCKNLPKSHHNNFVVAQETTPSLSPEELQEIARSITVQVKTNDNRGSGILIAQEGEVYTVLTNAHVLTPGEPFVIVTPDGKSYEATVLRQGDSMAGNDLALLQFSTNNNYSVAELEKSAKVQENEQVLAAGFPYDSQELLITSGQVNLISPKPLVGGYQIAYNNEIRSGMSGGPLLNEKGQVIGVNGMGNISILNDAYTYEDGTIPSEDILSRLQDSSLAVPIASLTLVEQDKPGENLDNLTGVAAEVNEIAEKITVLINSEKHGNGSGAIVAQQGNTYYVLTAGHVLENQDNYTIITPDGKQYPVDYSAVTVLTEVDLAVVKFTSNETYPVAKLGKYDLEIEEKRWVFLSGFPGAKTTPKRRFTAGQIFSKERAALNTKDLYSFAEGSGYELIYTNPSQRGMSGGPVLDTQGRIIGINAAAEAEFELSEQVDIYLGNSLGVPITTFLSLATRAGIQPEWLTVETTLPPNLTDSEIAAIRESLLNPIPPTVAATAFDWLNYGNLLWRSFKYEEALAAFDKAIELKPDFYQAYYAKGLALKDLKNDADAITAFDQAIALQPKLYEAWREQSIAFYNMDQNSKALVSIGKAIEIQPKDFVLYNIQGLILVESRRYSEAVNAYSEALKIKEHPFIYNDRGIAYSQLEQYQQAIADFNKAIEINPGLEQPYYNRVIVYQDRGLAYLVLGQYQEAIADFNKVIEYELYEYYELGYVGRGTAYYKLGQYQQAIADFNKAIEINPHMAEAYYARSLIYANSGEKEKAIADLEKATEMLCQQGSPQCAQTQEELKQLKGGG